MTDPERKPSSEERSRWTREFLTTDFWKLVLKPRIDERLQVVANDMDVSALKSDVNGVFGAQFYGMALRNVLGWFDEWKAEDKAPEPEDLEPGTYGPRYPKLEGEE